MGKFNVKYLIIGGYAVMRYAEPRFTKDLDLMIAADSKNAEAVFKALVEFGAPLSGLTAQDFSEEGYFYQIGYPPLRVDILMSASGIKFDEVWDRREQMTIEGFELNFISKQDLINSKKASGRPQDLIDVTNLEKTK